MRDLTNTFTSKRQLVIPAEIRRKHGIQAGTKIKVLEDEFGRIVLQPITDEYIDRLMAVWQTGPACWLTGKRNIAARQSETSEDLCL
jgi:AbrB family looped-hinge helix DNA binding protein